MKFHCTSTMRRIELFDAIRFDAAGLSRDALTPSVRRETLTFWLSQHDIRQRHISITSHTRLPFLSFTDALCLQESNQELEMLRLTSFLLRHSY